MKKAMMVLVACGSLLHAQLQPLTSETSTLFAGAGNCEACHSSGGSVLTIGTLDVSMISHWRSTMMANGAEDPLWRAKVSAEVAEHPALQTVIESKCTRCHAPMGYKQNEFDGIDAFSIAEMEASGLALDGISCTICHQIQPYNFGTYESYTGGYHINDTSILWGPYVLSKKMVGYDAMFGDHIDQAELCATCHNLFTPFVDDTGAVAGTFAEQTPYLEWLNSSLSPATTCQTCHMPNTTSSVKIASGGGTYSPFWFHHFVGANTFNLGILRENIDTLQLSADTTFFDSTAMRTSLHLRNNAVTLGMTNTVAGSDLNINVAVQNRAGHKLPTGIPIRRLWVYLNVTDSTGADVFVSGAWDADGNISGQDTGYEPHHDSITAADQVQIYEGVMQDINNEVTHTLLRAASYAKDNRIPPAGFTSAHNSYDTVAVFGLAAGDPNFNQAGGVEGTGADTVHYTIGVSTGMRYHIAVKLCYQSVNPAFAAHLAGIGTDEANLYAPMYAAQDKNPFIIDSVETDVDVPVPVTLASFTAQVTAGAVALAWSTATETANLGFHVERSAAQSGPYEVITPDLIPGSGTTAEPHDYAYSDPTPPAGPCWYRLRQVDSSGSFSWSAPVGVTVPVSIATTPVAARNRGLLGLVSPARTMTFTLEHDGAVSIVLYGTDGRARTVTDSRTFAAGTHTVDLPAGLTPGMYLVRFTGSDFTATARLVVVR